VAGDVTDRSAVEGAVAGCDAVVHTASIYSYDTRLAADMWRVNVSGTDLVLDAALAAGCDPVIHVSSMVVLLPCEGPIPSDPHLPHAKSRNPYVDSKKAAEAVARRRQARGEPVVTVYLGSVWGPHDPGAGEMVKIARLFLNSPVPFGLPGSIGIVDVRAAGRLLSSLLEAGRGPRRILFGGRTLRWKELGRMVIDAAGARPRPFLYTPYPVAVVTGRVFQAISRGTGRESLIHAPSVWVITSRTIAYMAVAPPSGTSAAIRSIVLAMKSWSSLALRIHFSRSSAAWSRSPRCSFVPGISWMIRKFRSLSAFRTTAPPPNNLP